MTKTQLKCCICADKRYLICTRDDGRAAIERCDACQDESFSDEDAAKAAIADGVRCEPVYPCLLLPLTMYAVVKVEIAHRGDGWIDESWPVEAIVAGYLTGALGRAMSECDARDKVLDLAVFGANQSEADRKLIEDLLK